MKKFFTNPYTIAAAAVLAAIGIIGYYRGWFKSTTESSSRLATTFCPDWSMKPIVAGSVIQNVSNTGMAEFALYNQGVACPTCILYNGIKYYFNGNHGHGERCYFRPNPTTSIG